MAIASKVKFWALNYYYMSIGKEIPEDRVVRVQEAIVNSDYGNFYEEPLGQLASLMETEPNDQFAADVQNILRSLKLPCVMHLLSAVIPYIQKKETLQETLQDATNQFKQVYKRCIAICKEGSAFSTYCDKEGQLVGDYPIDCIFIGFSEYVKTKGDIVGEMLQQNPSRCDINYLYAIMNLNNGGMFDGKFIPSYDICGRSVTLIEYAENYEVIRIVESMPDVYDDKWEAAIEHLKGTDRLPEGLSYLMTKCGLRDDTSSIPDGYSELYNNLRQQAESLGIPEEELSDPEAFQVTGPAELAKEWLDQFGEDITLKQVYEYFSDEEAPMPTPNEPDTIDVVTFLENGGSLSGFDIGEANKRAVTVDYLYERQDVISPEMTAMIDNSLKLGTDVQINGHNTAITEIGKCKTISDAMKSKIKDCLCCNSTEILDVPYEREIADSVIRKLKVAPDVKELMLRALMGEEVGLPKADETKELTSDDYFMNGGMEILKAAREAIWADQSPANRLKWGPCVQAFLRMLMGAESNKQAIKEHLTELAATAQGEVQTLLYDVVSKYFE